MSALRSDIHCIFELKTAGRILISCEQCAGLKVGGGGFVAMIYVDCVSSYTRVFFYYLLFITIIYSQA